MNKIIEVQDLQRVHLDEGDALVVRVDTVRIPPSSFKKFAEYTKSTLEGVFPKNRVIVIDSNVEMFVVSQDVAKRIETHCGPIEELPE
jgi:hypothetical protein